ncbi:hypothetical protein SRHO_G00298530 [Serrasalmus rhombeus]
MATGGKREKVFEKEFVHLEDLKRRTENRYLVKQVSEARYAVPPYPRPVEFHVSEVVHVTTMSKIDEILESSGWKVKEPNEDEPRTFLWWGLHIPDEEIKEAEARYVSKTYPNLRVRDNVLKNFTKSPVFLPTSRYGNFKFTLRLAELMQMYKDQICEGEEPVLRMFKTVLYRQEIMYTVLIHSPQLQEYDDYPVLTDGPDDLCTYSDGVITWRAQAISETHNCQLSTNDNEVYTEKTHVEFYVWDHVTLAFHLERNQTLYIEQNRLTRMITACDAGGIKLKPLDEWVSLEVAEDKIEKLRVKYAE